MTDVTQAAQLAILAGSDLLVAIGSDRTLSYVVSGYITAQGLLRGASIGYVPVHGKCSFIKTVIAGETLAPSSNGDEDDESEGNSHENALMNTVEPKVREENKPMAPGDTTDMEFSMLNPHFALDVILSGDSVLLDAGHVVCTRDDSVIIPPEENMEGEVAAPTSDVVERYFVNMATFGVSYVLS